MNSRHDNWPRILEDFIESRRKTTFTWGSNDCCLFAANAVRLLTGQDFAADLRGTYKTKLGAARVLKKHGGIEDIMAKTELPEQAIDYAQRGDVVQFGEGNKATLGVCIGTAAAFVSSIDGLVLCPLNLCTRAWRVGRISNA